MALLPLAGWAQTDISGLAITLNRTQLDYTGLATGPVITAISVGDLDDIDGTKLTIQYYDSEDNEIAAGAVRNAGDYKLALKGDGTNYTAGPSPKVAFTINKGALSITLTEATEKTYGSADPTALEYTWDDPSQLKGTDDVNNVILTFTLVRAANENVGTYTYTSATATTPNYDVTVNGTAKLKINKRDLTGNYTGTTSKFYGDADPAFDKTKLTFVGWADFEDTDEKKAAALTIAGDATLAYEGSDANYNNAGDAVLAGKALYPITITGVTSGNYNLILPAVGMMIKQRALAATPGELPANNYFTYTKPEGTFTYNGAVQKPAYVIKYKDAQGTEHTLDDAQVALTYAYTGTGSNNNKDAGTYKLQVAAVATGNYSGSVADVAGCDYTIDKKDLWVYATEKTKVYDHTAYDLTALTTADFGFNGLQGDDNTPAFIAAITGVSATWHNTTVEPATDDNATPADVNATGYTINPAVGGGSNLNTNYNPITLNTGKFKITARSITVTAVDKAITFGDAEPVWASSAAFVTLQAKDGDAGLADAADEATVRAALTVALDEAHPNVGVYNNAIVITDLGTATNYAITPVAGKYTVNGAGYTMIAQNKTITYGTSYTLTDFVCIASGADPVGTVEFELWKDGAKLNELPVNAGTYDIKIVEKASYLPANYELPITYVPGTFTINKKALTITPKAVTLNVGASKATLNKYGTVSYGEPSDLVGEDQIKFELQFTGMTVDANGDLDGTDAAGVYDNKITLVAPATADGFANANYTITPATGNLTLVAADALMLATTDGRLADKIADVDGVAKDVAFGDIAINQKEWYAMVLPFATTPAELVTELGTYVVVNKLVSSTKKEDGSADVKFGLEWDEIAAGEPFLIKVSADGKNWNAFAVNKEISKDITPKATDFATFTGTYDADKSVKWGYELDGTTENADMKYKWLAHKEYKGDNNWKQPKTNAHNLIPMEAYLVLDPAITKANIFVEDFENGVTAIKSLSGDQINGLNVVRDGWYTLNGVKLQSAPTQKGVYIQNGKKVIIK